MLKEMADAGLATELHTNISSDQIRQQFNTSTTRYPQDNDSAPAASAGGAVSGDMSDEGTEEIYTDATLLDRHVRELLQSAGVKYDFRRAVEVGAARKLVVDDDLINAWERLEAVAPLLNKLAEHAQRRGAMVSPLQQLLVRVARGSASGSQSGSQSGSESGSVSGSMSGNPSGSASGSASGSESGEMSKTLVESFMAGDREAGLKLMGRR